MTEVTKDAWGDSTGADHHAGHNILVNSLGMLLRKALNNLVSITQSAVAFFDGQGNEAGNVVAQFGADGAQIGAASNSHLSMDYHSMQMVDKGGDTYLYVSDLRDDTGVASLAERFTGDGGTRAFTVSFPVSSVASVTVNGSAASYTRSNETFTMSAAPADEAEVVVSYTTTSEYAKAYTLGVRSSAAIGAMSMAEGSYTTASGMFSHAEGYMSTASGKYAHAEGCNSRAKNNCAHAEGLETDASGMYSHAEGYFTTAKRIGAHAEGNLSKALRDYSHAEGYRSEANGVYSHAEGSQSYATGIGAHAEGGTSHAYGQHSHAEGGGTYATGAAAHAEGSGGTASGSASHAEGVGTEASGDYSHAEGGYSTASGDYSHAGGFRTVAEGDCETRVGKYNIENSGAAFAVGNGTASNARSDAFAVSWGGAVRSASNVTVSFPDGSDTSDASRPSNLSRLFGMVDDNGRYSSYMQSQLRTDGYSFTELGARSWNGSASVTNLFRLTSNPDGSKGAYLSDPAVFCEALHVGDRVTHDQSTAVSMANGAWGDVCSISLPAGTWVIEATVQFASNATGRRYAAISETSATASATVQRQTAMSANAVSGAGTYLHTGATKVYAATTTVYLLGWQNSGAALSTYGCITAVRIK